MLLEKTWLGCDIHLFYSHSISNSSTSGHIQMQGGLGNEVPGWISPTYLRQINGRERWAQSTGEYLAISGQLQNKYKTISKDYF